MYIGVHKTSKLLTSRGQSGVESAKIGDIQ